jgi:ketosteroid isomerase-like protein
MGDNASIVRRLAERFLAGDRAGAVELFSPDLVIDQPGSLPHGGTHHGVAGMAAMAEMFGRYWDRRIEDIRLIEGDDVVVQVSRQTWKAKATGRSSTADVVELFGFGEGRITEIRVFPQDTHAFLATIEEQVQR